MQKGYKDYTIRSYDADLHGKLKLTALINFLQDIAHINANENNFGYEYCAEHNLAWVLINYHIKIKKLPSWNDVITIATWASGIKKITCTRDFTIYDSNKEEIISATTQWVAMDITTQRPTRINFIDFLDEKVFACDFEKIASLENIPTTSKEYQVRYYDIDVNQHVNNTIYLDWAFEAFDNTWKDTKQAREIEISYKDQTFLGDEVLVQTQVENNTSVQLIYNKSGKEAAKIRINWE